MLVLITNPTSGGGLGGTAVKGIEAILKEAGVPYRVQMTQRPGHATQLAREAAQDPSCEAVISIGGDGTSYEVAAGMMDSGKPMGIIPAGTGNDFIKSLGYPKNPEDAMRCILKRELRPVDLVTLNDRCYLNVTGTGFDVTVLQQAERYRGRMHGMLPYFLGLLRAIRLYRPVHVRVESDEGSMERDVLMCAVANGRFIGGGIPICPAADPGDGLLDLVVVNNIPRWKIPFYLPGLMMGKVLSFGITEHVRCKQVTLSGQGMDIQIDGEITRMEQAAMRVCPGKLLLYR